jgi:wyosine [tRNA(Phe)-imidazoG37] synthetase (radical SAM superfamily)
LSTKGKTCNFDCIYCQLGKLVHPLTERREFVKVSELATELKKVKTISADYATFSGMGEPTLASNLGEAINLVKAALKIPVAVLTNSSLMVMENVRRDLGLADVVVAKLDAPNQKLFQQINRPFKRQELDEIIHAIKLFRKQYQGKLALQMMFVGENKGHVMKMRKIAEELDVDEAQINTPLRPCAVQPLSPEEVAAIRRAFSGLKRVVTVYDAVRPEATPFNQEETLLRRPTL